METVIYCEAAWAAWLALPVVASGDVEESGSEQGGDAAGLERLLMAIVGMLEASYPEALQRTRALMERMAPGRGT